MDATEEYAPVGAIVLSHRDRQHYAVLSHNDDDSVTVLMLGGRSGEPRSSRIVTHSIPMHPKDEIVGIRERLTLYTADHAEVLARRLWTT